MALNGPFVVFLVVGLVAIVVSMSLPNWVAKLILFVIGLGAASITLSLLGAPSSWSSLTIAILFILTGVTSVRLKPLGNRILGFVLIIVGIFAIFPAIELLGFDAPGTIWDAVFRSLQQGWSALSDTISSAFGNS